MRQYVLRAEYTKIVTIDETADIDEQIDREFDLLPAETEQCGWEMMDTSAEVIA